MGRVLVIGAGLAGLTAARLLSFEAPDREVIVIDKGRSVGGRLATRRLGPASLDHGAQFFTVRSEAFGATVDRWRTDGMVEEWCRGFGDDDGYPRYYAVAGMNALAKYLAKDLSVVTRQRANAIVPGPDRWAVAYEAATRDPDEADALIVTPPIPQALDLLTAGATVLPAECAESLGAVGYHKVIAILARLDRSPNLPLPGALQQPDHPVFSFVADNQVKGISDEPAVTCHMTHELSGRLWGADDASVLAHVDRDLRGLLGEAQTVEVHVKRWRYAAPIEPAAGPCMVAATRPGPLVLAGDGFSGSKVEGAFLSGRAAAAEVAKALTA